MEQAAEEQNMEEVLKITGIHQSYFRENTLGTMMDGNEGTKHTE